MKALRFAIGWGGLAILVVAAGCNGREEPSQGDSSDSAALKTSDSELADPPADNETTDETTSASETNGSQSTSETRPPRQSDLKVLSEREPIETKFPDGSLKARWNLRLYVTFNNSLPIYQQAPGSYEFHGPYEEFYPGGQQLFMQGNYVNGVRDGEWTYWHPSGAKAKQGRYVAGGLDGEWNIWREDGTLLRTENYRDGEKFGTWKFYAEDGETVTAREEHGNEE